MVELPDARERRQNLFSSLTCDARFAKRIIGRMPAMVCQIAPDGTTLRINPAGEKMTGYRSDQLIGQNWWRTFYPGELSVQVENLVDLLQQGDVRDHEMAITTRNGDTRTISWNSLNCYNEAGALTEMVGFGIDITDRKRAEEALRRSQVHLEVILEATTDGILAVDATSNWFNTSLSVSTVYGLARNAENP